MYYNYVVCTDDRGELSTLLTTEKRLESRMGTVVRPRKWDREWETLWLVTTLVTDQVHRSLKLSDSVRLRELLINWSAYAT